MSEIGPPRGFPDTSDISLTDGVRSTASTTEVVPHASRLVKPIRRVVHTRRQPVVEKKMSDADYKEVHQRLRERKGPIDDWFDDWKQIPSVYRSHTMASETSSETEKKNIFGLGKRINTIREGLTLNTGNSGKKTYIGSVIEAIDEIADVHPSTVLQALYEHVLSDQQVAVIGEKVGELRAAHAVTGTLKEDEASNSEIFRDFVDYLDEVHLTSTSDSDMINYDEIRKMFMGEIDPDSRRRVSTFRDYERIMYKAFLVAIFGKKISYLRTDGEYD